MNYEMTHETEISIEGFDIKVLVFYEEIDCFDFEGNTVPGTDYEVKRLEMWETWEEYLEATGGDGIREDYDMMCELITTSKAEELAYWVLIEEEV